MKKLLNILFVVVLVFMSACSSDPKFPDPGYDMITDQEVSIRRDTSDSFTLALSVKAPAGIKTIQLLNGRTYKVVEEFPEYAGKTFFDFVHTFNFKSLNATVDTSLIYNIRIVTNDNRGYNKSIQLNVIKLSVPEFATSLKSKFTIFAPLAVVQGTVTTGLYHIKDIKFYIGNDLAYTVPASELVDKEGKALSTYDVMARVAYPFVKGQTYQLRMIINDDHNQSQEYTYTLTNSPLSRVRKIYLSNGLSEHYIIPTYNDKGQLISVDWFGEVLWSYANQYVTNYFYDENGRLSHVYQTKKSGSQSRYGADFTYDEQGRYKLVKVWNSYPPYGSISQQEELHNFVYNSDGTIKSYNANSSTVDNIPYQNGFLPGEKVWSILWDTEAGSGDYIYEMARSMWWKTCDLVPVLNPLYIEGADLIYNLPYADSYINQPIHFKYVFASLYGTGLDNFASKYYSLPYSVREDGQLRTWRSPYRGGFLRYIYEDDPIDME